MISVKNSFCLIMLTRIKYKYKIQMVLVKYQVSRKFHGDCTMIDKFRYSLTESLNHTVEPGGNQSQEKLPAVLSESRSTDVNHTILGVTVVS